MSRSGENGKNKKHAHGSQGSSHDLSQATGDVRLTPAVLMAVMSWHHQRT